MKKPEIEFVFAGYTVVSKKFIQVCYDNGEVERVTEGDVAFGEMVRRLVGWEPCASLMQRWLKDAEGAEERQVEP